MTTKQALNKITTELKKDKDYREAWKSSIAISYIDSERLYKEKTGKNQLNKEDKHIISNNAAERFITLLCEA